MDETETGAQPGETGAATPAPGYMDAEVIFEATAERGQKPWHWAHLKLCARTERALRADPTLNEDLVDALLERDTLPRVSDIDGQTLVILRGINHDPNADPEDMISIRFAITADRIISLEFRRLRQIDALADAFRNGHGPKTPGAFVRDFIDALRADAEPVLDAVEDRLARLEQHFVSIAEHGLDKAQRRALVDVRQDTIQLQRFIAPQATALDLLTRLKPAWLADRRAIREEATAFRRISADLDSLRMRAQLVADEAGRAAVERTNRTVLLLSVVSVVFLPLTFLTGLLGVNLGGIPGADSPAAFTVFTVLLVAVGLIAVWIARRLLR